MIKLEIDIELSEEQVEQFAEALYYGSDLIADIRKCIDEHPDEYSRFLEKERGNETMNDTS